MKATIISIQKSNNRILVGVRFEGSEVLERSFSFIPEEATRGNIQSRITELKTELEAIEAKAEELQDLINLEI